MGRFRRVRGGTNYLSQRGAAAGAYTVLFARAQTSQCEHLMDCFIDPFDRPGDAVLSQRRGLLIVDRGPCLCPLGFR